MFHIDTAHDIAATAARPVVTKAAKAKVDCMWSDESSERLLQVA